MRKFRIRSAKPSDGGFLPASDDGQKVWYKREWRLIALLAIMIVAFVIRFVFAYGVSAGSDFALSGGTGASNHAHTITSILNGSFAFTNSSLNFPYGSVNIYPIFMDVIMAAIAWVVSLFGVSIGTAVGGTLAFSAPIIAALTCWPVYLIGRKMFNDEKIGLLSALLYAFFALLIMTTVFSNGTEYALLGFLFAFMVYYMLKAFEECDDDQPEGFRLMIRNRAIVKDVIIAGILFTMIILTWNQFRVIILILVFLMVVQALVDRLRGKAVMPAVGIYSGVLLIGVLISLPYYVVAGLWSLVFSGPFVIAILSVALAIFFGKTSSKTWVLMLPVTIIIAVVVLAVIFFASGDLFTAVMAGNSVYTNELMGSLASSSSTTSMSSMAAFFGWLTLWLPLLMFIYMVYKYRKEMDSKKYAFTMWWIFLMFIIGWYSTSYAFLAGAGFAVASASLIIMAIRMADVKGYFKDMRGNGIRIAPKKLLKPIPLATVIVLVALIAVPNVVYAIDASTPSNTDSGGYLGGLGYTVMTNDLNTINKMWTDMSDVEKDGALITWLGYSTDAVSRGGFDSVTDSFGGGASTMSAVLLANSSSSATASMAIRLLLSKDLSQYETAIKDAGLDYNVIKGYIDNPSTAVDKIKSNLADYSGISANVTQENALYLVLSDYITSTIPEPMVDKLYDKICLSGESINYVSVDVSMLPLYYNDSSYFSTIAYLGSYNIGAYGAPTQFFSYDTSSGYATYTDAMYNTFFWKALIGMSPSEAGYSSSTSYLNALALSDGSVIANPGYGLANYDIVYWHVYYNPDSSATTSSSGWVDMDAKEAMNKQSTDGGVINFVNGVVMLQYDSSANTPISGTVSYNSQSGITGAEGIQVSVFTDTDYNNAGVSGYVKRSTSFTDANGNYSISVPNDTDYYVVFSSGTNTIDTGSIIETRWDMSNPNLTIPATSLSGIVYVNNSSNPIQPYTQNCYVVIQGQATGASYQYNLTDGSGNFAFNNIIPDVYSLTVFSPSGTTINTGTATVTAGTNSGFMITATSGTLTVTVNTDVGASAPDGTNVVAKDSSTGVTYAGNVVGGKATINVVPSTYTVYATGSVISVSNPSSTVSSNGSSTATLVVYDTRNISVSGAPPSGSLLTVMSYGFVSSSTTSVLTVPKGSASTNETYTVYAVSGSNVYYGATTGSSVSLTSSVGYEVSGSVKDSSGNVFSGTVSFIKQDGPQSGATFVFTSDSDGNFDVTLPAGTYIMYIYGSSLGASLSMVTVSDKVDLGSISLSKSRDITTTVNYYTNMSSATTRALAFVDVTLSLTINDTQYNITVKTSTSGGAVFTIPQGYAATATSPGFDTAKFHMDAQSRNYSTGTTSTTYSWTLAASMSTDSAKYVKPVSVTSSVPVTITLYNSSSTTYGPQTSFSNIVPGQYTAVVSGSTGYFFNGSVYVYPGQSGAISIASTNVVGVILNASSDDTITVTPTDTDKGNYYLDPSNSLLYYLQYGKSFYFQAVSTDGDIAYGTVNNITSQRTLDLSNKAAPAVIDGYAGVAADGTLTVTYGSVIIPFPISAGVFEITVPTGTAIQLSATMTQTIGSVTYTYKGSTSMAAGDVVDGATIRFHSTTSIPDTSNALDGVIEGSNFSFDSKTGIGSLTLKVYNTNLVETSYIITGGSAWVLDQTYMIKVPAATSSTNGSNTITVQGRFNPALVGAGNANLSLTVTSVSGTALGTYVVDAKAFVPPSASTDIQGMYVDLAGTDGAFSDAANGYEYMYAVTLTNSDNFVKTVSISIDNLDSAWSVAYADQAGGMIYDTTNNSFSVNGFSSTVVYIKLMCKDGSQLDIPSINVTVKNTSQGQFSTKTSEVTISGDGRTATFTMKAQSASMEAQNMSATGNNIFGGPTPVPATTMVLLVLCIIGFIAMVWLGVKKGVLVRRR